MGELSTSPPPAPVVLVDGDPSVDLGTVGVKSLQQAVVADPVPNQISASRARRRVPVDDDVAREGSGGYALRRSRRGGRSRRDKKQQGASAAASKPQQQQPEMKTILKRLSPTDLAALASAVPPPVMSWDYEAQRRELQRQREWYLMSTAADPYFPLPAPEMEDWSPRRPSRCRECEAAAAAMREPAFHWCVRDAVTVGFRSPVGPIERPPRKSPSPPPASPGRMPPYLGMSVY